jgi:hypothetical protein
MRLLRSERIADREWCDDMDKETANVRPGFAKKNKPKSKLCV